MQTELGNLDKKSQKEVQSFIEQQQQMQQVQAIVGKITELCWDKCVSKPGKDLSDTEKLVSSVSVGQ
jgi:import inner membrane translocase subunit TIM8